MKKLTKLLSVFIIAGAVGTSVASVAACSTEEDPHTHSYTYTDNGDGRTHTAKCKDGDEEITDQLHVDSDDNKQCDLCGAAMGTTSGEAAVTGVSISGLKQVAVKGKLQLTANVTATGNAAKTVTWSSSDESKATVSTTGEVTGVAEGPVTITATSTYDTTKKADYAITVVAEGTVIEKPIYNELLEKDNVRIQIDTQAEVGTHLSEYNASIAGIYVSGSDGYAAETHVEYADEDGVKVLKQVTTRPNVNGAPNVYTIINPGPVKGEVEGVFSTKVSKIGNNGDMIVFRGNSNINIEMDSNGVLKCNYNSGAGVVTVDGVKLVENTYIEVYFKFNLTEGKTTIKINGVTALNEAETGVTLFNYVQISSSNKGQRIHTTKDIVICGTPKTLEDSKTEAKNLIDAELAKYDKTLYSINGNELDVAVATAKTSVDAAEDIAAVNSVVADCKKALAAVLKDSDIEAARVKAVEDLQSDYPETRFTFENLTGDDEKYNNKALYAAKIAEVTEALQSKNSAAEMKEVTNAAGTYLAGKTNSEMLKLKVEEAKTALTDYATSFKETLTGDNAEAQKAAVDTAVTTQSALFGSANQIAEINTKLEEAKTAIQNAAANVGKPFTTVKDESKTAIDDYCTSNIGSVNSDTTYVGLINASVAKHKNEIDLLTEDTSENRNAIDAAVVNAKADIDRYIDNYTKQQEANAYRDAEAAKVKNNEVKAKILALDFTDTFKEITEVADRTTALAAAEKEVKDIVDSLATYEIKIDVGAGESCYVIYGTKLTLSDLRISGFNVSAATLNGKAVPVEASDDEDLTIYNPVAVTVTGKTPIAGFKVSEQWLYANLYDGDKGIIADNNLFTATATLEKDSQTGALYAPTSGVTAFGSHGKNVVSLGNITTDGNNKNNALTIIVNCALSSLNIKVIVADSAGTKIRTGKGNLHIEVNDVPVAANTGDNMIWGDGANDKLTNLKMGDVVTVWAEKPSAGGRMYLAEINAEADTSKIEKTVNVTWGSELPQTYHYFEAITAPNPTGLADNEKFEYWYYMDGDNEVKWTDGTILAEGNHTYIAKISIVAAVESVEVSESAQTVEIGGNVTLNATAKDADGNVLEGRTVTWSVGDYQYAEISADGVLMLKDGAQENDTITVTATIGTKFATVTITVIKASNKVFDASNITSSTDVSANADLGNGFFIATGEGVTAGEGKLTLSGTVGVSSGNVRRAIGINLEAGTYTINVTFNGSGNRNIKVGYLDASNKFAELGATETFGKGNGLVATLTVTLTSNMNIYIGASNSVDILKIDIANAD